MKAVFCGACCSLVGYFKNGVAAALQHYGPGCPWCSSSFHHNKAEMNRQQAAHLDWAMSGRVLKATQSAAVASAAKVGEPIGHAFFEYEVVGDVRGAPREVVESREDFINHVRTLAAPVGVGGAELD